MNRFHKIIAFGLLAFAGITGGQLTKAEDIWIPSSTGGGGGITPSVCSSGEYAIAIDGDGEVLCASIDATAIGASTPSSGSFTTLAASGTVTLSGGTASRLIFTDGSKNLVYSSTSSVVANSVTDETGSGALVFGTAPTLSSPVITGGSIDNTPIGSTTASTGAFSTFLVKNGSSTIVNAMNTDPDVFSGDLVQVQMTANGGGTITGSADTYRLIRADATLTAGIQSDVFTAAHFQVSTSGSASMTGVGGSGLRGVIASAVHNSTGTIASMIGINSNAAVGASGGSVSTGAVSSMYGNRITTGYVAAFAGTGSVTSAYGVYVLTAQNVSASRTIGTFYGLYVDDVLATGVGTGYSIYTGTGKVRFGGSIEFSNSVASDPTLFGVGRNADSPNALEYFVPSARIHKWTIDGTTEMTLSATALDFQNNSLTTTGGGSLTGTWSNLGTVTTIDINGGTLDGTVIGGSSASAATFTTVSQNNLTTYTGGAVISASSYQCGRDSDATNQLHCNVPSGATFEFSINDVPEYLWTNIDLNLNNNTLSNIGSAGTDFLPDGRLVIAPTASASGSVVLTLTQANHTAITTDQPALNITSAIVTVNSGSTVGTGSTATINAITYNGVAGGGAETISSAVSLRIVGAPVQGSDITLTNKYALWVDADSARFDGRILGAQGSNVASAATITLGDGNFFHITGTTNIDCITTTGWTNGSEITLEFDGVLTVNDSTGGCGAGTSNVNLSAAYVTTADDTLHLVLDGGSWDERGRSIN